MDIQNYLNIIWGTHYLKATAIFLMSYVLMQILLFIFEKIFLRLAKKTKTIVDDLIVEKTRLPLAILVMMIGGRIAIEALQIQESISIAIGRVFNSAIVVIIAQIIIIIFDIIIDNWGRSFAKNTKSNVDDDLLTLFHRFTKIMLYFLALTYILTIWGVQVGPLVASLGVAGIAVAFALQSTLGNIFGGVALILDKAIRIGDVIELGDGTLGTVEKVNLRSTKIRTFDNELITIPNGKVADSKIINWYMPDKKIRISVKFSVEYGSDPDNVKEVIMNIMKKDKEILKDPEPQVIFLEMADFSLNFIARFWIEDVTKKLAAKDKMTTAIYNGLRTNKIGIPFPTRTIYMKKE